jgi:hypothetical protein
MWIFSTMMVVYGFGMAIILLRGVLYPSKVIHDSVEGYGGASSDSKDFSRRHRGVVGIDKYDDRASDTDDVYYEEIFSSNARANFGDKEETLEARSRDFE